MTKKWYQSTTVWIGILTAFAGIVPLAVELVKVIAPDATTIVVAVAALVLGVLQIVRRTFLDPTDPPAKIG
jgi:hypothetical protein